MDVRLEDFTVLESVRVCAGTCEHIGLQSRYGAHDMSAGQHLQYLPVFPQHTFEVKLPHKTDNGGERGDMCWVKDGIPIPWRELRWRGGARTPAQP